MFLIPIEGAFVLERHEHIKGLESYVTPTIMEIMPPVYGTIQETRPKNLIFFLAVSSKSPPLAWTPRPIQGDQLQSPGITPVAKVTIRCIIGVGPCAEAHRQHPCAALHVLASETAS
jgi:hypothetical protein